MWKFFKYLALAILLIVVLLGVWAASEINNDIHTWREELTIEVETPEGRKTASSVQKIVWRHSYGALVPLAARGVFSSARGEAPILEIAPGKFLFALFKGNRGSEQFRDGGMYDTDLAQVIKRENPKQAYPYDRLSIKETIEAIKDAKGYRFPLSSKYYPLLVTFKDINDPTSVQRVDPDDMDAVFGCPESKEGKKQSEMPWRAAGKTWQSYHLDRLEKEMRSLSRQKGIEREQRFKLGDELREQMKAVTQSGRDTSKDCLRLKTITLEVTDEPVTRGKVETVLGWFSEYRKNGYRFNGEKCVACPVTSKNLADLISTSEFKIGD